MAKEPLQLYTIPDQTQQVSPQTVPVDAATVQNILGEQFRNMTELVVVKSNQIQSGNFVTSSSGWKIDSAGNAEFNSGVFRGNLVIGGLSITMDNTGNIQTNINTLNTNGGGTLYLKAGTYTQNTALTGYSSVRIIGISPSQSTIDFNHTASNLTFAGTSVYTTGTITSITSGVNVTGSGTTWVGNVTAGQALFIGTRWYTIAAVLTNTTLTLAEAYGDNVTMPGASYRIATVVKDFLVSNVTLKNSTGTAMVVTDGRQYNINDVLYLTNSIGYSATNVSEMAVNQLISVANTSDGVQLTNIGVSNMQSFNVIGNTGNGLTVSNMKSCTINPIAADSNTGDGVNITTGVNIYLLIDASANGGQGIELVSGCDNVDVCSGTIQGNTSDGIKFTATDTNCHIYACDIVGNGGYGANVVAASDSNNIFTTNNFASNTSGAINDVGTGTLVRGNTGVSDNATGQFGVTALAAANITVSGNPLAVYMKNTKTSVLSFDNAGSSGGSAISSPLSSAITVGSGTNNGIWIMFNVNTAGITGVAATCNGNAMTQLSHYTTGGATVRDVYLFFIAGTVAGSASISISWSGGNATVNASMASYFGVAQSNQSDVIQTFSGVSSSLVTLTDNSWVGSCIAGAGASAIAGNTNVTARTTRSNNFGIGDNTTEKTPTGSITSSWTLTGPSESFGIQFTILPAAQPFYGFDKASSSVVGTSDTFIGFLTQTAAINTLNTVVGGGLLSGFTGLSASAQYYLNDAVGTIGTSVGTKTRKCGISVGTTQLLITNIW